MTGGAEDRDRLARARNIAAGAKSLPEPLRASFVENACRGDARLRADVRSLLGWAAEPVAAAAPPLPGPEPPPAAPPPPAPPPPAAPPPAARDFDRELRQALEERPAGRPPRRPLPPPPVPRRVPVVALLAAAAAVWLGLVALNLSRQVSRVEEERDTAVDAAARDRGTAAATRDEAARARREADVLARLLATAGPDTLWRDRIAMRRFLDHSAADVGGDSTLDAATRARLLDALAAGYRARGFADRADSLAAESGSLRGVPAPSAHAP